MALNRWPEHFKDQAGFCWKNGEIHGSALGKALKEGKGERENPIQLEEQGKVAEEPHQGELSRRAQEPTSSSRTSPEQSWTCPPTCSTRTPREQNRRARQLSREMATVTSPVVATLSGHSCLQQVDLQSQLWRALIQLDFLASSYTVISKTDYMVPGDPSRHVLYPAALTS